MRAGLEMFGGPKKVRVGQIEASFSVIRVYSKLDGLPAKIGLVK